MTNCVFSDYFVRRFKQLSQGMYKKVTYIRMRKFMIQKRKSLFIPMKVQFITISSVIPYISEINSTSSSLKKKKNLKKEKERGKERKRECERKGKRDGKEKENEKEREEERVQKRGRKRKKWKKRRK